MHKRLWWLAERMDWNARFPRRFWRWLLKYEDRRHGFYFGMPQSASSDVSEPGPTMGHVTPKR